MSPFCFAAAALFSPFILAAQVSFDLNAIDKTADPCNNFYQYACGNWLKNNPIPADQSSWGRFNELHERNQRILRDLLETSAAKSTRSPVEQKIGDYFQACMDEKTIEQKGGAPLKPTLDRIAALQDKQAVTAEVARLHVAGVKVLFDLSSGQDLKDASKVIVHVDQGGIGLPERDYYLKSDPKSVETRTKYVAHVRKMFELLGQSAEKAVASAQTVMKIETALAKGSMDITSRRDPTKLDHPMSVKSLTALAPSIDWPAYLSAVSAPVDSLNVVVPDFFKALDAELKAISLDELKTYMTWHLVHADAPVLSSAFVNENFEFYGKSLTGAKELRPRWKRCVQYVDGDLGEALGQKYVEATSGTESKQKTLEMVKALGKALDKDLKELDWMTPETKLRAAEKLHAIADKIGFPDKWRDYTALDIQKGDLVGNSMRANSFEWKRQMAKIGKPVDKSEWYMTPATVNAYYDPQNNNINFPAGILQPPFYDNKIDLAVNLGGIGAVIGHELTHGFDDQGSQFDAKGNLANWWSDKDRKAFDERTGCFDKQYAGYTAVDDLKLNGKLTLGENTADNGGLRIAYMALLDMLGAKPRTKTDGYTPEQRFFLGFGQVWCTNITDQATRLRTQTDPHSPGVFRVNGTVSNMPEFQSAFGCKADQPMVRGANACRVW